MTSQEKKSYLLQYSSTNSNIERLLEERERWRSKATKITQSPSDQQRAGSNFVSIQSAVEKIDNITKKLAEEIASLAALRINILTAVEQVENTTLGLLLHYRYIDGLSLEKTAEKMGYSYIHVRRLHGIALMKIKIKMIHNDTNERDTIVL